MKKLITEAVSIILLFGAGSSPLWAAKADWKNLERLKRGQFIRVLMSDAKSFQGEFRAVTEQGITLRQSTGELTLARKNILRVSARREKARLWRNMVIGGAVGAVLFALPAAIAIAHNGDMPATPSGVWPWVVFVPAGALVGAAFPCGGWQNVYRAHRKRSR